MKTSICHYSLGRVFTAEKWSLKQLAGYIKDQGVDAIDFHVRYLPEYSQAEDEMLEALDSSGLELSGLSLSTNFNQEDEDAFKSQIETAQKWLEVAGKIKAPASRVFGGHIADRTVSGAVETGMGRVRKALQELLGVAESNNVILALENHGGLPCSGEEQVAIIEHFNHPFLKATVDVGNYMAYPQDPVEGTGIAAKHCAYVHLKDNNRLADGSIQSTVIGEGDVDIPACLSIIKDSGFNGYVALEYEGKEDQLSGVPKSVKYMQKVLAEL